MHASDFFEPPATVAVDVSAKPKRSALERRTKAQRGRHLALPAFTPVKRVGEATMLMAERRERERRRRAWVLDVWLEEKGIIGEEQRDTGVAVLEAYLAAYPGAGAIDPERPVVDATHPAWRTPQQERLMSEAARWGRYRDALSPEEWGLLGPIIFQNQTARQMAKRLRMAKKTVKKRAIEYLERLAAVRAEMAAEVHRSTWLN